VGGGIGAAHDSARYSDGAVTEPQPVNITCQDPRCDAYADMKIREYNAETGETYRWWYLCVVHVQEEFEPWLGAKKKS